MKSTNVISVYFQYQSIFHESCSLTYFWKIFFLNLNQLPNKELVLHLQVLVDVEKGLVQNVPLLMLLSNRAHAMGPASFISSDMHSLE